jgi:hypothetical protein
MAVCLYCSVKFVCDYDLLVRNEERWMENKPREKVSVKILRLVFLLSWLRSDAGAFSPTETSVELANNFVTCSFNFQSWNQIVHDKQNILFSSLCYAKISRNLKKTIPRGNPSGGKNDI